MAGRLIRDAIKSTVEEAQARSYGGQLPDDEITPGPGGSTVVKAMGDDDLKALNEALMAGGYDKGLNLGRIGEIFNSNPGEFDFETVLTNIKQNNKELFEHLRRETKTIETLTAMAEATGFENIMHKFLNRKPGEVLPSEDVVGGLIVMIRLGKEIQHGANAAVNTLDAGARDEAYKKLRVIATIQSNLAAQVSGNVSEYGRGLSVISKIAKIEGMNLKDYTEQLDTFVNEMDDGLVDYHLHVLAQLHNPMQRARYTSKGFGEKSYDFAMENYINALLSSPVSHMVNMAGNASFQMLTLAERGLAGVVGNIRTLGGIRTARADIGDQRYIGEAAAEAHGLKMAGWDALVLMANTFVTGESSDLVTKIDLKNRRALGSTDNMMDIASAVNQGDYFKAAIDTLGIATRLPGRFLATEDEFFKVISMRRVLYREAHRAMQTSFTTARRSGMSREEAKALSEAKYLEILQDTPDEIERMMTAEARKMTFQGAPEGFFGRVAPIIRDVPLLKPIVPFYNTPTNVIMEAYDRTLNWSPVYRAIKQSDIPGAKFLPGGNKPITGVETDDAIAKLMLGNMLAMTMFGIANGDYGDDLIITGGGPTNFGTKIAAEGATNVPKYSVGKRQDDGSYRFASLSRFDPISAMLMMGADMAEYARYEDDPAMLEMMFKAYTLSAAEYAGNMPFLQGVSELTKAAGNRSGSPEDFFERMSGFVGGQVGSIGTNVLGNLDRSTFGLISYSAEYLSDGKFPVVPQSALHGAMERLNDPFASNTMLPPGTDPITGNLYTEAPAFMQGFYSALQKAKNRNPFFSDQLPGKLDFWGRPMKVGEGRVSETFNPVRIQSGEYSYLDQELIRLSEVGAGSLYGFHPKRIDGTLLNGEQYNQFVMAINEMDAKGRRLGDPGYKPDGTLLNALKEEVSSVEYLAAQTDEDRYDMLSAIVSNRRSKARKWMVINDPNLSMKAMVQ